jgi:hypothetical protein
MTDDDGNTGKNDMQSACSHGIKMHDMQMGHDEKEERTTARSSPIAVVAQPTRLHHDSIPLPQDPRPCAAPASYIIKYLYPLLYACHLRHGSLSLAALKQLEAFISFEAFHKYVLIQQNYDIVLHAIMETIQTACQQAIRERMPIVTTLISKVSNAGYHGQGRQ